MRRTLVLAAGFAAALLCGAATASAYPRHRADIETWRYHQQRAHHYDGRYADVHWRNRPWYMGRRQDWAAAQRYPWRGRHDWDGWDD